MKRKVVLFAIFLAILLPLLALWAIYLYEVTYAGRELLWIDPEYTEFKQALEDERIQVVKHDVSYAGSLAIVDFKAVVTRPSIAPLEFPYGERSVSGRWQVVFFFGIVFVSLGATAIFQPGGSSNEEIGEVCHEHLPRD